MNKIYTIIAAIILSGNIFAQSPKKISYQAVIRDSGNSLVKNQLIGMQISILRGIDVNSATSVYKETQTQNTNVNGLVSLEIGTGNSTDEFSAIDWGNGPFFIKTETDLNGGTDYTITGINQLLSVPFAFYATNAGNIPPTEYTISLGLMAGNPFYRSLFSEFAHVNENYVSFKPIDSGTIVGFEIKVHSNGLNSSSFFCVRKNGTNTNLSITIPKGGVGYYTISEILQIEKDDELNLFIDTSGSQSGEIYITIRTLVKYNYGG
jgi:hypothetical protein